MDDQYRTKEQCLEELQQARAEVARLRKALDQAQSAQVSHYQAALKVTPEMMFWFDSQGVFIDYKASTDSELFIPPEMFMGKHYSQVVPPHISSLMDKAAEAARRTGEMQVFQYEMDGPDGPRMYDARLSVSAQDTLVAIISDVTYRVKMEAALAREQEKLSQSEARLAAAQEMVKLAYWEYDIKTGLFTFNDPFYALLRTTAEREGGYQMPIADYVSRFIPAEDAQRVGSKTELALKENNPGAVYDEESRMIFADGTEGYVLVRFRVVQDENGRPVKLYGMNQDVTETRKAANELARTELMYRQILDSISDMILVKGPKSKIVWGNRAFRELYGMTNEQLKGMIDAPVVEPDYTQKYIQDDEYVFHSGKSLFVGEEPITRFDGVTVPVESVKSPVFDQDGKVIMTVGVFRDITESKRASEAIESHRRNLQAVLDNMPAGVFMVEAPSGRPILSNKKAEEFLGRGISPHASEDTLNEMYQAYKYGTEELYPAQDMPIVAGLYGKALQISDMEVRKPDGSRVLLEVTGTPVFDSHDKLIASLVIFQDITEREQNRRRLQREMSLMRNLIDSVPDLIFYKDLDGVYFGCNKAFEEFAGITEAEMIGKTDADMFPQDVADFFREQDQQMITQRISRNNEEWVTYPDGRRCLMDTLKTPFYNADGEVLGLIGIGRNITERKKNEEIIARRATEMAVVSQLATTVATNLDPDVMLQTVVDLTKQAFDFYHVHVYMYDEATRQLNLAKGAGEVGSQMVAEGRHIPLDAEISLVARAARSRVGTIVNDVTLDPSFLPHRLLPETRSEMAVPMIVGDRLLGVLDVQSNVVGKFTEEDVLIITTLTAQVSVALRNAQQYAQVQEVLGENRQLYQQSEQRALLLQQLTEIQAGLSRATSEEEIVAAVGGGLPYGNQIAIGLGYVEEDEAGNPSIYIPQSIWRAGQVVQDDPAIGYVLDVKDSPLTRFWIDGADDVQIVADWRSDSRVDDNTRKLMEQFGNVSIVVIPMKAAGHWQATMSIFWPEIHAFTEEEIFLLRQLREPLAAVVASRRAYLAEEQALAEAETLYQVTSQLAGSHTFDEVLNVIVQNSFLKNFDMAMLQFFNIPWKDRVPETATVLASWMRAEGASAYQKGMVIPVSALPSLAQIRYQQYILSGDLQTDTTLSAEERSMFLQRGWRAGLYWRLTIGDEWVGTLYAAAKTVQSVGQAEIRRMTSIIEQSGTVIRNLQLMDQVQKALNETANLYMASRRLSEANNLQAMVAAVAEGLRIAEINRAVLVVSDANEQGEAQGMSVVANWHAGWGVAPAPVGMRLPPQIYSAAPIFFGNDPVFIDDVKTEATISQASQAVLEDQKITSLAVLPLWAGSRQLGVLLLEAETKHEFTEEETRKYQALVRQMALAVEGQRLYEETRARARREQTLREITSRVRSSMDPEAILRTAARELGSALGRPTFVRLGSAEQLTQKPDDTDAHPGNGSSPVNGEGGK